jgi:hypothetical protein
MCKLTLGYGSFPHPKVGARPLVWEGDPWAWKLEPWGVQFSFRMHVPQGLLDEVFVRGTKRVLRVRLQHVDPWESRPEALNAPCFFNLWQSNKTNSSE